MFVQIKNELEKNEGKTVTIYGNGQTITGTLTKVNTVIANGVNYKVDHKVVSDDGLNIAMFNVSQVRFFGGSSKPFFQLW